MRHPLPRILFVLAASLGATVIAPLTPAAAQGYLERKDADAAAVLERAVIKAVEDPRLFDGRVIVAGADLGLVRALADGFALQLRGAERSIAEITPEGRKRHAAVIARYREWETYGRALIAATATAVAAAEEAARRDAAVAERDRIRGLAVCEAFRGEVLADPTNYPRLEVAARIAAGTGEYWQTVEEVEAHVVTLRRVATACTAPGRGDVGLACAYRSHVRPVAEATWCAAAASIETVVQRSAKSLAAWHATHLLVGRTADKLASYDGWLEVEGGVTWDSYFSGAKTRAILEDRLAPILAHAGLTRADDGGAFDKLAAHFAALEAKVRELAPSWKVPGSACAGVACAAARKGVAAWNTGATILRVTQDAPSWKIAHNALGIPTHRWKSGYALLRVKGDPLCQLRSWTVSEDYAGGGRYQPASQGTLGYVRWQACK